MRTIAIIPTFRKPELELRGPGSETLRVNSEHTPHSPSPLLLSSAFRQVQAPGFRSELCPVSDLDSHKHSRNLLMLNAVTRGLALQKEKQRLLGESSLIRIQKSTLTPSHDYTNDKGFWFWCLRDGGRQRNDLTFYLVYERKIVVNKGV